MNIPRDFYVNRDGLDDFRREMAKMGFADPQSEYADRALQGLMSDIFATERAEYWCDQVNEIQAVLDAAQARHARFRACALLMIAALVVIAVVGWLR